MFGIRKDDKGFYQGFTIAFENGYEVSVQFGRVNYCSNKYLAKSNRHSLDSCNNCETAIFKPNGKFLKYKGDDVQSFQTADEVAETIAYVKSLEANNYGRINTKVA
jgi:hypothetical protein